MKPPITCHETINKGQKYSQGFVSAKRSLSDTSSDLSSPKKRWDNETKHQTGKSLQSLSPLKSFKNVWMEGHPRISNPSKCKADNSVCKKYVSCQLERTGKNYLNSKFSGKLKGKSEEKEVRLADTQMKYGKGKCFPSKTKQLVKGKNSVRQVAPEKLTKNVMDNSFENKNNNLMHASLSRETLPTDRLQSDL